MKHTTDGNAMIIVLMSIIAIGLGVSLLTATNIIENRTAQSSLLKSRIDSEGQSVMQIARQLATTEIPEHLRQVMNSGLNSTPQQVPAMEFSRLQALLQDRLDNGDPAAGTGQCQQDPITNGRTISTVRIFVSGAACNEPLPPGVSTPNPSVLRGDTGPRSPDAGRTQELRVPFVVVVTTQIGDIRTAYVQEGESRVGYGDTSVNSFALLITEGSASDSPLDENLQLDGPVLYQGVPQFKDRPYFGKAFISTGIRLGNTDPETRYAQFQPPIGRLLVGDLRPAPNAPCFNTDCPTFVSGAELASRNNWWATYTSNEIPSALLTDPNTLVLPRPGDAAGPLSRLHIWYGRVTDGAWTFDQTSNNIIDDTQTVPAPAMHISYCDSSGSCSVINNDEPGNNFTNILINGDVQQFGGIDDFTPMFQSGRRLSVAATGTLNVTSSVRVPDPACVTHMYVNMYDKTTGQRVSPENFTVTPAQCPNLNSQSLISLYSGQDIVIGESSGTSDNITIHAAMAAPQGTIRSEASLTGKFINILGSMASRTYTAFERYGTNNYQLRFDYDPRFGYGYDLIPSGWPIMTGVTYVTTSFGAPRFTSPTP